MALVAVAGRRRAYTVCTSVGQDGGWARIGSLGKVRIGSLGKVQSAWCNRTGSRAGWGSAVQLPPRPGGLQCSSLRGPGAPSGVRTSHASVGGSTPSRSATLAAPLTPLMIFPPSVRGPLPPTRTLAAAKARRNSALDVCRANARGGGSKKCGSHAPWCTRRSSRGRCGPCRPPPPARPARRHPAPRTAPAFS